MTTKASQELKAELQTNFYGINPGSLRVECVSLTRGGLHTHWHAGRWPRFPGEPDHPAVMAPQFLAAMQRWVRHGPHGQRGEGRMR